MALQPTGDPTDKITDEIHDLSRKTVEMLRLTWSGFRRLDARYLQPAENLGREVHQAEKVLTERIVKNVPSGRTDTGGEQAFLLIPTHLERIGDNIELLIRAIKKVIQEGIAFSERANKEINTLFEKDIELLECVRDVILTRNRVLIRSIVEEGRRFEEMADNFAVVHQQRLIEGVCVVKASSVYLAIVDYLKGIEAHACQIAQKLALASAA
ncbi:MAG: Na/Pi cotransporter family protein [Deltaproteobacteria bacterium]|nr:Na/Pi cotransporter family protein [Deltaproteobacteria bacterium]